jgi:hypothetical protein
MGIILSWFRKPQIRLIIILLFLLGYIFLNCFLNGFSENFLSFGPTKQENGEYITFMGLELNNWKDVIIVYVLIFVSTIMQYYYTNFIYTNISSYVFNPLVNKIPYNKFWTYILLLVNPLIRIILFVVQFLATATFQLQYLIPQFLGGLLINLPYVLPWLSGKKFLGK